MKKWIITFVALSVSLLTVSTIGQATDKNADISDQLLKKGFKHVKKVHTKQDTIHDVDQSGNPADLPPKSTLNIDVEYATIQEANEDYGNVVGELFGKTKYYTGQVGAEYIKLNIFKGDELVGFYAVTNKGERIYEVKPNTYLSILGMGLPMSKEVYDDQQKLINKVKNEKL